MFKKSAATLAIATTLYLLPVLPTQASAVEDGDATPKVDISMNVRADFSFEKPNDGDYSMGFHGRFLNLIIKGDLNDKFSYSFRQRLNKFKAMENDVFAATDWVYLNYKPSANWTLSAGKQIVAIGGYEYDSAPIDIYYSSIFWQHINCYQFGVSGAYTTNNGRHSILAQICNSPATEPANGGLGQGCFAYNLMWNGDFGFWHTIWSANAIEYQRGDFASYIALGNRFTFGDFALELDLMNRHSGNDKLIGDDWTIIGKANYNINNVVNVFMKGGYDKYKPNFTVHATVSEPFYGGGVEVFPLKNKSLRIHALWVNSYSCPSATRYNQAMAGITWAFGLYKK